MKRTLHYGVIDVREQDLRSQILFCGSYPPRDENLHYERL